MKKEIIYNVTDSVDNNRQFKICETESIFDVKGDLKDNCVIIKIGDEDVLLNIEEAVEILNKFQDFVRDIRSSVKSNNAKEDD